MADEVANGTTAALVPSELVMVAETARARLRCDDLVSKPQF
jgi:hypothetical protein